MLIDLHCHTKQRSPCSRADEEDMIRHAIWLGLDGIAITDHNKLIPADRLRQLNEKYHPFTIFSGIEITLDTACEALDFLVLGLHDPRLEDPKPRSANGRWMYNHLHKFVRRHGGFLVYAHPFRFNAETPGDVMKLPPDALEIRSLNIRQSLVGKIEKLAAEWKCPAIGTSDAHFSEDVGSHAIRLDTPAHTDAELIEQLRKGTFVLSTAHKHPLR